MMAARYGRTPWELVNSSAAAFSVNVAAFRAGVAAEAEARRRAEMDARNNPRGR